MQLPMGKIASIWEIFLKEIQTTYADRLHELLPAAQQKGERGAEATSVAGPLLVSLSYVVHLFVALIDSVLLVNTTAPMVLDLVSKTCAELVSPLLVLAVGDRSGQAAAKTKSPAVRPPPPTHLLLHWPHRVDNMADGLKLEPAAAQGRGGRADGFAGPGRAGRVQLAHRAA